ncbi:MAG: hypothetical protein U9R54_07930 [Bacteroidota bacterium]|nr:hypothetical protein [Bacteroidota bacterium]
MKMKYLLLVVMLFAFFSAKTQNNENFENRSSYFSYGFSIKQYQNDFGLGLNVTTPYFWNNRMAVRLKTSYLWYEHIPLNDTEYVWSGYQNIQFGLIGIGGMIGTSIRLYGEGGIVGIFPNSAFSDKDFVFGGYGLFGFEFYTYEKDIRTPSYYIEIGSIGSASADKLQANPVYSNGLTISAGIRF